MVALHSPGRALSRHLLHLPGEGAITGFPYLPTPPGFPPKCAHTVDLSARESPTACAQPHSLGRCARFVCHSSPLSGVTPRALWRKRQEAVKNGWHWMVSDVNQTKIRHICRLLYRECVRGRQSAYTKDGTDDGVAARQRLAGGRPADERP